LKTKTGERQLLNTLKSTTISRSALETLFECEYKRYFNYEYDKKGIVSTRALFDTDLGIALHDGLYETLLSEGDYSYLDKADLSVEDNTLIHGHLLTFKKDILPLLLDQYDVVSLEQEWSLPIPETDLHLALRMDAIMRHKETGQLEIIDWKSKKALGWIKDAQYKFNLQTALYTWALEEKTGEDTRGITYFIFEKGEVKLDRSKAFEHRIRHSPYCYGWKSQHGAYQSKWSGKGWEKVATWKEMPIEKWTYSIMDEKDRKDTFLVLPNLSIDKSVRKIMIDNAVQKEVLYRKSVAHGSPALLFRNHQACNKFGVEYQCPYFGMCWYNNSPTKEEFTERVDHHGEKED
jgi:hypothetical protein